jgi:hypothetical protein
MGPVWRQSASPDPPTGLLPPAYPPEKTIWAFVDGMFRIHFQVHVVCHKWGQTDESVDFEQFCPGPGMVLSDAAGAACTIYGRRKWLVFDGKKAPGGVPGAF